MKISNKDIRQRIYSLNELYSEQTTALAVKNINLDLNRSTKSIINETVKLLQEILYNTNTSKSIEMEAFDELLEIFEYICEKYDASSPEFDKIHHILTEATDRTRSPKEMQALLKRRITLGTKSRGVNKLSSDISNTGSSDHKDKFENTLKSLTDNLTNNKIQVPAINTPGSNVSGAKESCYNELINKCEVNAEVDKILSNYNKLSKRFNIDRVLDSIKNSIPENIDCYYELFDTWPDDVMSQKSKFNVAIHTALYLNDKQNMHIDRASLIESIVDYFLFKNDSPDVFDTVYSYLESNSMITAEDLEPYTEIYNRIYGIIPEGKDKMSYIIETESKNPNKNLSSSIKNFKASSEKNPNKFKDVIANGYNKTPEQIVDETPKIFDVFRFFVIVGTVAINPILGLITFMTDQFVKREYRRPEAEKMINKYQKEIDKVDKKINTTDNDEKKKRLKEYKKTLEDNMMKLQTYEQELYTDEENERREEERLEKNMSSEYDFDFDEASAILQMTETVMNTDSTLLEETIQKNISMLIKHDLIDEITDFAIASDGFLSIAKIKSIYEAEYYKLKHDSTNKLEKYVTLDTLKNNINKLNRPYIESTDNDISEINRIAGMYLFIEALNMIDSETSSPYFLEVSFNNIFNVIKNKLQDAMTTISDKEKELCHNIDIALNGFKNKVEKCMNSDAREQVLKGSVLPSASKILKMALAGGLVSWLIHPVVAVIGLLGYIGVSKATQNKERQLILDEIDTELEMVDRYIAAAEQRDDLKAIKNLLTTKKKLQRERLRIKYKMKQHGEAPDRFKGVK